MRARPAPRPAARVQAASLRNLRLAGQGLRPRVVPRMPAWAWALIGTFAVLFVLGVILDLRGKLKPPATPLSVRPADDVREALRLLGGERVRPSAGGFSVAAPAGWTRMEGPEVRPYQIVFHSAHGVSLSLMATPVAYDELRLLGEEIRQRERERDLATTAEIIRLEDRQAIQRRLKLVTQKVLALDFVEERVAYHALGAAPEELYDLYEPLFLAIVKSLRAEPPVKPEAVPAGSGAGGTPGSG